MAMTRPAARGIDRMGFDPNALMLDSGEVIDGSNPNAQLALENQVEGRRQAYQRDNPFQINTTGSVGNFDGFFGALQAKENYANSRGKDMRVDLMGRGPGSGTGFGRWEANVDGGNDVNLDEEGGGQQLAEAQGAAEAARAAQKRQQDLAVRPAPYTGPFSQQGVSPEVGGMVDAAQAASAAQAAASSRRVAPPPAVRRNTIRRSAPVNQPQGTQTYTTSR